MVQINFARKEINCKIVYYGPGLSGKTTNLEQVHAKAPSENKGELTSISTDGDRTLFFDFMPLDLGSIAGMRTKFHIYTVPGQVYYNSTRKLVLLGADGVIFVADSSPNAMDANKQSLENLKENLAEMGKDIAKMPLVMQWNKRDVEGAIEKETMEKELNLLGAPSFEAVASKGEGVIQTLKAISALVLESINANEKKGFMAGAEGVEAAAPSPAPQGTAAGSGNERRASAGMTVEHNEVTLPPRGGASPTPAPTPPEPLRAAAADARPPVTAGKQPEPPAAPGTAPRTPVQPVTPPQPMKRPASPLAAAPPRPAATQPGAAARPRPGTATAVKERAAPVSPRPGKGRMSPPPVMSGTESTEKVRPVSRTEGSAGPVKGRVIGGKPRKSGKKNKNTLGIVVTLAVIVLLGGAVAAYLLMLR